LKFRSTGGDTLSSINESRLGNVEDIPSETVGKWMRILHVLR
jgi:hypothetical protein